MAFAPADTLRSRTFVGLILAQFLAAFNDQAIHASAMFYAIHRNTLTEANAISLMPVLFYAPWAIFCTLAGYLADHHSKRDSLVFWKIAEVGITLVALLGFLVGTVEHSHWGPWIVLSTVFLMGTHSAFFVPAKYGAMPEILQPHLLSKGNGVLESTSFLAVILGTVAGGVLSDRAVFRGREQYIGFILVGLAVVGACASLLIRRMPAANPTRPFPRDLFRPLVDNMRVLLRSRPLALSVLGIAFFTFMVAFMRATVYMHGESQNPHWDEFDTSLVVGTVALGVGLGSPLAGFLSGGKVELGLVPIGAIGMILGALVAALTVFWLPGLVVSIILIGFCSGFYIVPLYTLLQHRAPKTSKGDLIATSNFINVTGGIAASVLFKLLVVAAAWAGIARPVAQQEVVAGELQHLEMHNGRPVYFEIRESSDGPVLGRFGRPTRKHGEAAPEQRRHREILAVSDVEDGARAAVSTYTLRGVPHFEARPADEPLADAMDNALVPRYLFLGAGAMTLTILIVLCQQLPDFLVRGLLWLRSHGRYRLRVIGESNVPHDGPVILATNCARFHECMQVIAATDRYTRFVLLESASDDGPRRPLLRYLARRTGLVALRPNALNSQAWEKALGKAARTLDGGNVLAVTAVSEEAPEEAEKFLTELQERRTAAVLPVVCRTMEPSPDGTPLIIHVHVAIGQVLDPTSTPDDVRRAIRALEEAVERKERADSELVSATTPGAVPASPTVPAADRRGYPSPG
jgi:MFS family permease